MKQFTFMLTLSLFFVLSGCSSSGLSVPFGKKVKKEYFTGGQIRSEFIMDDDSGQNGTLKKYGYDGKITSIAHIKNGVRDGIETWYDKQGRVLMRVPYVNGKKHGIQEAYYENGDIMVSYTYENGVKNGPATSYNKDGSIHTQVMYDHGKIVN
jgi:antitoxin component YwqK of YwqJK toxin-antitoxin module